MESESTNSFETLDSVRVPHNSGRAQAIVVGALWFGGCALIAYLIVQRYRGAIGNAPLLYGNNVDFRTFLQAAGNVDRGASPYGRSDLYTYFAPLALFLSLAVHTDPVTVLRGWTVFQLASLMAAVALMVWALRNRLTSAWQVPVLFTVCAGIALHVWPMVYEFFLGNDDVVVLLLVVIAAIAWKREAPVWFGIMVGCMCLIKVWPALVMIAVLQVGVSNRRRALSSAAFVATVVVGLISNLIPAGGHEFTGFVRAIKQSASLHLVSDSVIGIPKVLFSTSGLAKPLVVSSGLRYLLTVVLATWVLALLVITLRNRRDPLLTVFNVMLFAVLVIPVSHMVYTILALPLVWFWLGNAQVLYGRTPRRGWHLVALVGIALTAVLWVVVQSKAWPGDGSPAGLSSIRFTIVFIANLALYSASVLAGWLLPAEVPSTELATTPTPANRSTDLNLSSPSGGGRF